MRRTAVPRFAAIRSIPPTWGASAPKGRRSARRSASKAGCCIPRSTAPAQPGTKRSRPSRTASLATIAAHGADSVAFYVSGQLLTEDYYVANKLMKGFIGSANIDTNSRLCMASAVAGYKRAFGADTVPNDYTDLEQAELIVLVGSNLAWCHPVLFQRVSAAKAANPKLRVVRHRPAPHADRRHRRSLPPATPRHRRRLVQRPVEPPAARGCARSRVPRCAYGRLRRRVARREGKCGIDSGRRRRVRARRRRRARVLPLVRAYAADRHRVLARRQSIDERHRQGQRDHQRASRDGPHRQAGHGAVLADGPAECDGRDARSAGSRISWRRTWILPRTTSRASRASGTRRASPRSRGSKPSTCSKPSSVVRSRPYGSCRRIPSSACRTPIACGVRSQRAELVVVSDCVRDTDTTRCAHVLLPAATWGEKSGTVTNSERRISRQRQFLPVPGEAQPDWWIVTQVAAAHGFRRCIPLRLAGRDFPRACAALGIRERRSARLRHRRRRGLERRGVRQSEAVPVAAPGRCGAAPPVFGWAVLHAEPQGAARADAAARTGLQPEQRLSARAEHGPSSRSVAHDDAHR